MTTKSAKNANSSAIASTTPETVNVPTSSALDTSAPEAIQEATSATTEAAPMSATELTPEAIKADNAASWLAVQRGYEVLQEKSKFKYVRNLLGKAEVRSQEQWERDPATGKANKQVVIDSFFMSVKLWQTRSSIDNSAVIVLDDMNKDRAATIREVPVSESNGYYLVFEVERIDYLRNSVELFGKDRQFVAESKVRFHVAMANHETTPILLSVSYSAKDGYSGRVLESLPTDAGMINPTFVASRVQSLISGFVRHMESGNTARDERNPFIGLTGSRLTLYGEYLKYARSMGKRVPKSFTARYDAIPTITRTSDEQGIEFGKNDK